MAYGSHIRGRVWRSKRPVVCYSRFPCCERRQFTWYYEVVNTTTGEVLTQDNTGAFEPILRQCLFDVAALRRVYGGFRPVPKKLREVAS